MSKIFSGLFKKLKSIKHIEIILAILLGLIILLVYFSSTNALVSSKNNLTTTSSSVGSYTQEIEYKLENLLSSIDGAGKVEVMIMCESGIDLNSETVPKIKSVVIVASGASVVAVKLNIIKATETLLSLKTSNIEVLTGGES